MFRCLVAMRHDHSKPSCDGGAVPFCSWMQYSSIGQAGAACCNEDALDQLHRMNGKKGAFWRYGNISDVMESHVKRNP